MVFPRKSDNPLGLTVVTIGGEPLHGVLRIGDTSASQVAVWSFHGGNLMRSRFWTCLSRLRNNSLPALLPRQPHPKACFSGWVVM